MDPVTRRFAVCFALVALCVSASVWAQDAKNVLDVDGGKLKRGPNEFTVRAIYAPDLGKPGTTAVDVAQALNAIAKVGGNSACFDLYGFNESGGNISSDALSAMRQVRDLAAARNMITVVRVFGPHAPSSERGRLEAAKTCARLLKNDRDVLYLLEGSNAKRLAREFKRRTVNLAVASPEDGDVQVVTQPVPGERKRPALLLGSVPVELAEQAHFILPEGEESYEILDAACALIPEHYPWTPDNSSLTPEERAEGWIALFDGKSLNGWTVLGDKKDAWQVHDGILERVSAGSLGVRTIDRYGNFILRWEWCLPEPGNNGVHIHAPRVGRSSRIGFEYQMLGDYGEEPNKNSTGSIYDVLAPSVNASNKVGEWNASEVVIEWPHVKYVLNGVTVQDVNFTENEELRSRLSEGFIVLTEHNDSVMYRNIKIKPLP